MIYFGQTEGKYGKISENSDTEKYQEDIQQNDQGTESVEKQIKKEAVNVAKAIGMLILLSVYLVNGYRDRPVWHQYLTGRETLSNTIVTLPRSMIATKVIPMESIH